MYKPNVRAIVASSAGDGFIINYESMLAQRKSGKKIMNLKPGILANCLAEINGKLVATVGLNRKLLIFKLDELPELDRGKGVRMQKLKDSILSDVCTFHAEGGLEWKDSSGRKKVEKDISNWIGKRAQAGKLVPKGFPRNVRFNL